MTKYAYAERVTKKVRKLLKHDYRVKDFIQSNPLISINGNYCLESIVWRYYDTTLIVTERCVILKSWNTQTVILEYNSFDSLLSIE